MDNNLNLLKTIPLPELTNWSVRYLSDFTFNYNEDFQLISIGEFLIKNKNIINIQDETVYRRVTVRSNNKGVHLRNTEIGKNIGTKRQYLVNSGQFILSKIDARNGAMGIIPDDLEGAIVTNDFPTFFIDKKRINPQFLLLITTTKTFIKFAQSCSSGTTNRQRINIEQFLNIKIPLPNLKAQNKIVTQYKRKIALAERQKNKARQLAGEIENYLFDVLGIVKNLGKGVEKGIQSVSYSSINKWSLDDILKKNTIKSNKYKLVKIESICSKITDGTHQTPKYFEDGVVFLSARNVTKEVIDWNNVKYVSKEANEQYKKRVNPQINDIFLAKNGTTGVAAILEENKVFSIYVSLALLRPLTNLVDPYYLLRVINSEIARIQFFSRLIGIGVPNLHLGEIREVKVPLPPINIQKKIAKHISILKNQINDLSTQAKENQINAIKEFEQEIFQST